MVDAISLSRPVFYPSVRDRAGQSRTSPRVSTGIVPWVGRLFVVDLVRKAGKRQGVLRDRKRVRCAFGSAPDNRKRSSLPSNAACIWQGRGQRRWWGMSMSDESGNGRLSSAASQKWFRIEFPFREWWQWGSFKIPFIGVMVLTLLLLAGSLNNIENSHFVQKVVIWVLGAAVISYGHSLAYSTQKNWQGKDAQGKDVFKDLSKRSQGVAVAAHLLWFVLFIISCLWLKLP